MERGDYLEAVSILSEALALRPSADTYLALGLSYRRSRDWQKAEDLLKEGAGRFPNDPRIPTELANAYLDAGDIDGARDALHRALEIDPVNAAAAGRLASVELSEGNLQTALRVWNRTKNPIVSDVLHNSNTEFGHWTVRKAHAFRSGSLMSYTQWRTTEKRLLETDIFSNVGLDIEPAPTSSQFNPIILTTKKQNDLANLAFGVLKGAPWQISYLDWWDIADSGVTVNSSYRWDYNRKRGEVQLHIPFPVPGILFLHGRSLWRSERWDVSNVLRSDAGAANRFQYSSSGFRAELHYIPHYKFDFGGGLEYTNRYANGGIPELLANSSNSAKVLFQGSVRLADNRYRNRIHSEGYVARKGLLGDLNYSAVTVELNNQFLLSKDNRTTFEWTVRGGTSSGQLPVEEYFVLGVDNTHTTNLLRGHPTDSHGHYGDAPMGTSFALSNMEIERRIAILPLFNTLNLPYLDVKGMGFLDSGQSWDREGIFKEGTLFFDAGAGLKFETRTHSLNLIYARAIHEGRNVLFAYIEKHW
jgi:hypothetical protein